MIKNIVKDPLFLSKKSEPASVFDYSIVVDLTDTLLAHRQECVGMAANMIGYNKTILVFLENEIPVVMINPVLLSKNKEYETMESCLSLQGIRKTKRYSSITVSYYDVAFKKQTKTFHNFTAEIIQHEMDHFEGILI